MNATTKSRWEIGLALFGAACFLACEGVGNGKRERDVEGTWHGQVEEKKREVSHDLRVEIDRNEEDPDASVARIHLDGETAWASRVKVGPKYRFRAWYEFPSGRTGRVGGRVGRKGWQLRGILHLEEPDGKVVRPRFLLDYGSGLSTASGVPAGPPRSIPGPEPAALDPAPDPVVEYYESRDTEER